MYQKFSHHFINQINWKKGKKEKKNPIIRASWCPLTRTQKLIVAGVEVKLRKSQPPKVPVWDLPDVPRGYLPPHLHLRRTRVVRKKEASTRISVNLILQFFFLFFWLIIWLIKRFFNLVFLFCFLDWFFMGFEEENVRSFAAMGVDNNLGLDEFRKNFRVVLVRLWLAMMFPLATLFEEFSLLR